MTIEVQCALQAKYPNPSAQQTEIDHHHRKSNLNPPNQDTIDQNQTTPENTTTGSIDKTLISACLWIGAVYCSLFLTMDNILQWNVRGASSAKEDLLKLIETYQFTVIAIQETLLGGDFKIKLPGYNGICKQGHYNHRFHGGVALYVHSSLPYEQLEIDSPHQIIAAKIQLSHHSPIAIASVFCTK